MASATATPRTEPAGGGERLRRFFSSLSIRLLAFNVLLVFLPAAGLLTLDTYERQLLRAQEQSMVQQARLLAAALADPQGIEAWRADAILRDLRQRQQARLRVVDDSGRLLADSSRLDEVAAAVPDDRYADSRRPADETRLEAGAPQGWLYWLGALPFRALRRFTEPPLPPPDAAVGMGRRPRPRDEKQLPADGSTVRSAIFEAEFYAGRPELVGSEVRAALQGRYGAATRISGGQRSVTLYAAIPVRADHRVIGAVLASQSTYGILQALYAVRLDVFKVLLAALAAAAVLSLLVSTTIARPLRRLRAEALALVDRRGRLQGGFRGLTTRDEIGDLTRALEQLTGRLREHMSFVERVASEVSHEFKNPLASIRTATELLPSVDDPDQRRRFLQIVQRDVARMERLLTGLREISRIDAQIDEEEAQPVDLGALLDPIVEGYRLRARHGLSFDLVKPEGPVVVQAGADRLTQVFENLLDNAVSFSPPGARVQVALSSEGRAAVVSVADQGPGIPPEHVDKIFARFFSYRPGSAHANGHAGLGLPIAKAIVEGYGGSIDVANRDEGGTRFEVRLRT